MHNRIYSIIKLPTLDTICFFIIEGCLQVNPAQRLTVSAILDRAAAVSETKGFNLKAPLNIKQKSPTENESTDNNYNGMKQPPPRPSQPSPAHQINRASQHVSTFFLSFK